jgi:hypothetical protein
MASGATCQCSLILLQREERKDVFPSVAVRDIILPNNVQPTSGFVATFLRPDTVTECRSIGA